MKQLHFFPARPAKTMRRAQRGTGYTRILNTLNVFKAFPQPNRARRMCIPTRFYDVLLAGMLGFALLLAGCGSDSGGGNGGGDDNRTTQDPRAVSDVQTIVGEEYITVSWTNPDQANIAGFNITRRNLANDEPESEMGPKAPADVAPRARVTHNITGLTNRTTYRITIAVLYENGDSVDSAPVQRTTGTDPDGGGPAPQNSPAVSNIQTLVGEDHILVGWTNPAPDNIDGFVITTRSDNANDGGTTELDSATADVAPLTRVIHNITDLTNSTAYQITIAVLYENGDVGISPSILSTTGADAGVGTDIDLDDQLNTEDNCPSVANSDQTNTDNSSDGGDACDPDDDDDGVNDFESDGTTALDNCRLVANADQANTDGADDGGDACDDDDDNDEVADGTDNCRLVANADQTNTDEASDGGDACDDDDDDDGTKDAEDAFRTDACAGTDTDGDGMPDSLVDGCDTDLTEDPDDDNDNVPDVTDVDDNNNSLIEIHNLDQLALLRDDLNGDGVDDDRIPEITSVGSMGCPDPDDDDGGCVGYELTRSLNFSDADSYVTGSGNLTAWTTGSGWQPIGSCSAEDVCTSWTGIFDGGGHTLADLFIAAGNTVNGVGLFGALTGSISNLHLSNARVSSTTSDTTNVGTLAGYGGNASYENLSVTDSSVMSPAAENVGGLVGGGEGAEIRYASVSGGVVSGRADVGGMVGTADGADIRYAYVSDVVISSIFSRTGGLVGSMVGGAIHHTYVSGGKVSGGDSAGGLIGAVMNADIRYSYAAPGNVSVSISSSGGLIGVRFGINAVNSTYWDTETTMQSDSAGDLGEGHSTTDLQSPTNFTGIYADWSGIWCDPDTREVMEVDDRPEGFLSVWDLGNEMQYPALNCMPGGLSAQGR